MTQKDAIEQLTDIKKCREDQLKKFAAEMFFDAEDAKKDIEALNAAIRSLEAWEKVKTEIEAWYSMPYSNLDWNQHEILTGIINKQLSELEGKRDGTRSRSI